MIAIFTLLRYTQYVQFSVRLFAFFRPSTRVTASREIPGRVIGYFDILSANSALSCNFSLNFAFPRTGLMRTNMI